MSFDDVGRGRRGKEKGERDATRSTSGPRGHSS